MSLMFKDHQGVEHDFDALPAASRQNLVNAAISHKLGNEPAAFVAGKIRAAIDGIEAMPSAEARTAITAWRNDHAEQASAWLLEAQTRTLKAVLEGSIGVRSPSRAVDPLEATVFRLAKAEMVGYFEKRFPRKDGDVYVSPSGTRYEGSNGAIQLVSTWIEGVDKAGLFGKPGEPNRPRLERAAKRQIEARNAAKAKAEALSDADVGV